MGADRSRDKRKRILLCDDFQRFFILPCIHELQICRDILMDGTSFFTRSHETVKERHLFLHLSGRKGFYRLHVVRVRPCVFGKLRGSLHAHACEYVIFFLKQGCHLSHTVISARLQERRRHGHRPDACFHDAFDIVIIRAARIGDAQFSVEFLRQLRRQGDGQRIQRFSGHVHLFAGELVLLHIHGECIGDLHTEFQVPLRADCHQPCQHGNCVLPLQVVFKMEITERHIIISHVVHGLSCELIPKERGIALDKGVESLLRDQVHGDPLDLLRRTSVKCGDGHGITDISGNAFDILLCHMLELIRML